MFQTQANKAIKLIKLYLSYAIYLDNVLKMMIDPNLKSVCL